MKIEQIKTSELVPYANNAKLHLLHNGIITRILRCYN